ncbi:MAG TPA: copper-translocating P-type ATPase [Rhodospirillales bacterium]|nr:copper-translocating P-type ATPase [Rhodospirillales bacterium]
MSCAACATRVQKALRAATGVAEAEVNLALERAEVKLAPGADPAAVVEAVARAGYRVPETRLRLVVRGMTCAACATRVEKALRSVPGVIDASVNLPLERAEVRVPEGAVEVADLLAAVRRIGYEAQLAEEEGGEEAGREEAGRGVPWTLLLAVVLTLPLVAQMVWRALGVAYDLSPWLEVLLATPVQFVSGWHFYRGAWKALKARSGNMDLLVAMGTSAAYLYSLVLVLLYGDAVAGKLYFEASAVIITLVMTGKWLEERAKRSASEAIRRLMSLRPEIARVVRDGREVEVPVGEVRVGDLLVLRPGERVPVDGEIVDGESEFDESLVTGESMPVARGPGQPVIAGALNGAGMVRFTATRVGKDTTLARIARLVEQAQAGKAPIQRLVDQVSAVFVPVVVVIALLTFGGWLALGGTFETALVAAVAVLVIACPCALGLATPMALVAGTGSAARAGILIRDIETLERAHNVDVVVFDKTGTLTEGRPEVTAVIPVEGDEAALLALAATAQSGSEHPLGRAMVRAAEERGLAIGAADSFASVVGQGVEAVVEGRPVRIGRGPFVAERAPLPAELEARARELEDQACTVVWVAVEDRVLGLIALADRIREDAARAVERLHGQGVRTVMLSGDNRRAAERVAARLGIDEVRAPVRPEDKSGEVERLRAQGHVVAMVGDGINDTPALAAADVGIAMGSGADAALETAGITLMRTRPTLVPAALEIAKVTRRKIWQNLFWAFIYNTSGIPLAAAGYLSPELAAAAMAASSLSVVTNSLTLRRWRPRLEEE